jgi:organic hydroperoxide reductase OsmC/OhrA
MAREYRFPVDIEWAGGRKTIALVDEKEPLVLATPPEFKGTDPDLWSPEDVFVATAGSCLACHDRRARRA